MSVESQIASLLKSGQVNVTDAINEIVAQTQPAEGFNTLAEAGNPSSKLLTIALQNGKIVDLLNSNISGDLNSVQIIVLANFGLQQGWFEGFMTSKKMEGKEIKTNDTMPEQMGGLPLVGTALAHKQIKQFLKHATHLSLDEFLTSSSLELKENGTLVNKEAGHDAEVLQPDFKKFLELALINLKPEAMQDFSIKTAQKYGQPGFGNGVALYDELIIYSRVVGQIEHLWDSYTSDEQQKGLAAAALDEGLDKFTKFISSQIELNIPIDSTVIIDGQTVSLISLALSGSHATPQKFTEFLKIAKGKIGYMTMIYGKDGVGIPLALPLLAFGKFAEFDESSHSDGLVDIGNADWGAKLISMCVQGGGVPQWEALNESEKLVGMLENFNSLVHLRDHEAPLVYVLAQNNMLDKVLGDLASKNMLEWKLDIDGDGSERGADAEKAKHFDNELDLGAKTWAGTTKKQMFQIGDGEQEEVTPLFMYQVPANSSLIGTMAAQGKLVMNLSGDVFGTAVRYMLKTDMIKSGGVWFKATIYTHQQVATEGKETLEVATLVSGGPKGSSHEGKLVYGIMPKNLFDGCVAACRGSVVDSTDSAGKISVDPFANSTFYWLKPFMATDAQPVDVKFLTDHGLDEGVASGLLGKSDYDEGVAAHYWLS